MIAMALACNPRLLIADEPTTALDVTIQAQILDLMRGLKEKTGAAIVLITHDLGVVAEMAQRVVVMYAGRKVEEAAGRRFVRASAPSVYEGLLKSIPRLEHAQAAGAFTARRDSRHGAVAEGGDRRLPVCAALRLRDRALPPRISAARGKGAGPFRGVLGIRSLAGSGVHERDDRGRRAAARSGIS